MTDTVKALARGAAMIAASLLAAVFLTYLMQQYSIRILDERFKWSNEIVGIIFVCLLFFWGPLLIRKWLSHGAEFIAARLAGRCLCGLSAPDLFPLCPENAVWLDAGALPDFVGLARVLSAAPLWCASGIK